MKSIGIHPLARDMARYCSELHRAGLSPARSGNVSARHEGLLWITATGLSMREVQPENLVVLWPDGRMIAEPGYAPSSELRLHQKIYEVRSDVGAVVHAHPPKATALAVARVALDQPLVSEITTTLGEVPLVDFQSPGTEALAEAVSEVLRRHDAILLANHGVIAVGKTLADAYYNLELVESFAEITVISAQMGGAHALTAQQVAATRDAANANIR